MQYKFDWYVLWQYRDLLIAGFRFTMMLFFFGTLSALILSIFLGMAGASKSKVVRKIVDIYVELSRNTPLVVKMFFLYFGFALDEFTAAVLALMLHQSAYMTEVVRAGIQTVAKGQMEAGLSSGFSRTEVFLRIILPQAFVIIIPPMTTQILESLKNTSVAMTISIQEITFQTQQIEALTFRGFEAATAGTIVYLLVGLIIAGCAMALENALRSRITRTVKLTESQIALGGA